MTSGYRMSILFSPLLYLGLDKRKEGDYTSVLLTRKPKCLYQILVFTYSLRCSSSCSSLMCMSLWMPFVFFGRNNHAIRYRLSQPTRSGHLGIWYGCATAVVVDHRLVFGFGSRQPVPPIHSVSNSQPTQLVHLRSHY